MALFFALFGMTLAAVAFLLVPLLLRRRAGASRDAYNLAVYRDQLAEIERDVARGVLDPGDAEAAKAEIGRRILALTSPPAAAAGSVAPFGVAVAAALLLPLAAWGIYFALGSPGLPDEPYARRTAAGHMDIAEALRRVEAHLETHPDDLTGWLLLGRTEVDLADYPKAVEAYKHAVDLSKQRPDIVSEWAEAQVLAAGGTVTPAAQEAFRAALADPEAAPRSRYYLALADMQHGDTQKALQEWVDLEADAPPDAPWLKLLRGRIAEAAKALDIDPATLKTSAGAPRKAAN